MKVGGQEICNMNWKEEELQQQFKVRYLRFSHFVDSALWTQCIAAASDKKLLGHIRFCNDVLKIAPVKTFLIARNLTTYPMTPEDNQAIGAFWGFIFKEKLGYQNQKRRACRISSFHTASVFL